MDTDVSELKEKMDLILSKVGKIDELEKNFQKVIKKKGKNTLTLDREDTLNPSPRRGNSSSLFTIDNLGKLYKPTIEKYVSRNMMIETLNDSVMKTNDINMSREETYLNDVVNEFIAEEKKQRNSYSYVPISKKTITDPSSAPEPEPRRSLKDMINKAWNSTENNKNPSRNGGRLSLMISEFNNIQETVTAEMSTDKTVKNDNLKDTLIKESKKINLNVLIDEEDNDKYVFKTHYLKNVIKPTVPQINYSINVEIENSDKDKWVCDTYYYENLQTDSTDNISDFHELKALEKKCKSYLYRY
jgi:hypothetical protein